MEPLDRVPCFAFWRRGCADTRYYVCNVLRLAGERVTPWNVASFVKSLPRTTGELHCGTWREESYCGRCVARALAAVADNSDGYWSLKFACEFLFDYLLARPPEVREMLVESFVGILEVLDVEGFGERERRRLTPSLN
jgi:hypothetical protein